MATVQSILDLQKCGHMTLEQRMEFKARGRDMPIFAFDGKRQCRLSEQYDKLEWLTGCPIQKSLFCFPCLVFKYSNSVWSSSGMKDLANFTNHVQKHAKSTSHLAAITAMRLVGKQRINKGIDEGAHVSRQTHNHEVRQNREMLKHHVAAAVFLATQGLAFRGHEQVKDTTNRDNFVELVELLSKFSSNPLLQCAVTSSNSVFSSFSSDIQNDIISCLHDLLSAEIKHRISNASFVSILAHECTYVANNTSQLAICVRLVYNGSIYEHLIDLVDVSADRSASRLADIMRRSLNTVGVDENKMVIGQSYSGTKNMVGNNHSVQTLLQEIWPTANLVHCYAHKWALVVESACADIENVTVFFGSMHTVINFFRDCPIRSSLIKCSPPQPTATGWLSRGKCTSVIVSNYIPICNALDKIVGDSDFGAITRAEAKGILGQIRSYDNVFLLLVFRRVFELSDIMTRTLQYISLDPVDVGSKVSDYRRDLCELRSESKFNELCEEVQGFQPDAPVRRRKRKINEAFFVESGYAHSAEETFDNTPYLRTFFEIIDVLTAQLDSRFHNVSQYYWVRLFQPHNFDTFQADTYTVVDLTEALYEFNSSLVPDKEAFRNELYILYGDSDLRSALSSAKDASSMLKTMHDLDMCGALPLITNALKASQTLALTTVAWERNFSVLRRLKTYMRSTMSEERLKNLTLLNIENELLLTMSSDDSFADKVLDRFASMKERQMKLVYRK